MSYERTIKFRRVIRKRFLIKPNLLKLYSDAEVKPLFQRRVLLGNTRFGQKLANVKIEAGQFIELRTAL